MVERWWTGGAVRGKVWGMSAFDTQLVARRHVDFVRVSSALCRRVG